RSSRAYPPFFFELFHQSSNLENGQAAELLHQFICICHFLFLGSPPPKAFGELRPTAISPDVFLVYFHSRYHGTKFFTSLLVRTRPPVQISLLAAAPTQMLVHSINVPDASPEKGAALVIAP